MIIPADLFTCHHMCAAKYAIPGKQKPKNTSILATDPEPLSAPPLISRAHARRAPAESSGANEERPE